MKKRIAFALCMILMVLMLGACGTDPTTVDYNGKSYSDLQSEMDTNAGMVPVSYTHLTLPTIA